MSVFQCHLFISNGIHQVHMKLLILDKLQWVNCAACTQGACHDHWGGKPWYPIH